MSHKLKQVLKKIYPYYVMGIKPFNLLLFPIAGLISIVFPFNEAYSAFSRFGFHLLRKHYYLPIPDESDKKFMKSTHMVGINIDIEKAFHLIENTLKPYNQEFKSFPLHSPTATSRYYVVNGNYMAIDGNIYYSLIRHHKPKKIVEIGSGNSTLIASAAIRKNRIEQPESETELTCIEPYPSIMIHNEIHEITQLLATKVQHVDLSLFESLGPDDILFIDSTHTLRSGGDVWWEYCEILPRLASGVLVHIHDISLPQPYPEVYLEQHLYWNEQYLLQAFLTFNNRFEIIWPGNYLATHARERILTAFSPEYGHMREKYPSSEPSAFWMRVGE